VRSAAPSAPSLLDADGKTAVSLHDLRRSAITNWSKFANIQTVMTMAGHSSIETTRRYYAAVTEDQIERVRQASATAIVDAVSGQTDARLTQNQGENQKPALATSTKSSPGKDLSN